MATTQMIRTEPPPTQPRWTSLSGSILEGGYELQDLLEATDTQARFKVRVLGDRELESVAILFQVPEAEIERQIELWRNVKTLRHSNISAPLGAGRLELDSVPLAYVVLRRADEALSGVLRDRPLTAEETGEAFVSTARALEALHLNGWAHGCLSPDQVLAVGDNIQLPGECARTFGVPPLAQTITAKYLAPESGKANLTSEADLWCLGATLFEALTKKPWKEESRDELEALPEPFATIVFRCLETSPEARCSLAEAMALYCGELKLPPRVRAAVAAVIVPPQEIAAAPEPPVELPLRPVEVKSEAQPEAKPPIEETAKPVEVIAKQTETPPTPQPFPAPQPVVSPAQPSVDKIDPLLPKAAAIAALALEANTQSAKVLGNSTSTNRSGTYTQPTPSLVTRLNEEGPRRFAIPDETDKSKSKWWIWGSLILVFALIWLLRPRHQASVTVSNLNPQTTSPTAAQSSGSAWQTRTLGPTGTTASASSNPHVNNPAHNRSTAVKPSVVSSAPAAIRTDAHARVPAGAALNGKNVWRVVLYTYNRLPDAEKKAKDINARHGSLHAEVLSPSGNSGPYLVTTNGEPSKEEALQARRKALESGMPHDAYIQNYSK